MRKASDFLGWSLVLSAMAFIFALTALGLDTGPHLTTADSVAAISAIAPERD